jgi:hypothetical protein
MVSHTRSSMRRKQLSDTNCTRLGYHRIEDSWGRSYNCVDSFQRAGASPSTQPTGWADQKVGVWHLNIQAGQQSIGVPSLRDPPLPHGACRMPVSHTPCFGEEGSERTGACSRFPLHRQLGGEAAGARLGVENLT